MPFYQTRGEIPTKRHTQFRDDTGNLYWEELISREGFSHMYSNVYHVHPPTSVEAVGELKKYNLKAVDQTHRHHHIRTANVESNGDAISSRIPLFFNSDVVISKAHVKDSMKSWKRRRSYFYSYRYRFIQIQFWEYGIKTGRLPSDSPRRHLENGCETTHTNFGDRIFSPH